ncbi:hypothetical protein AB6A40_003417 [Gnathostoma spinigerum]|uniref:Granulins domain-containing protein n=1 Tax=Gnathostoma spinigerum TaxID=75299 RepID=A0ABD6EIB4_9BILA
MLPVAFCLIYLIGLTDSAMCPNLIQLCWRDQTCCRSGDMLGYGCCLLPDALCCRDNLHCCPYGTHCNSTECTRIGNPGIFDSIPATKLIPAIEISANNITKSKKRKNDTSEFLDDITVTALQDDIEETFYKKKHKKKGEKGEKSSESSSASSGDEPDDLPHGPI